MKEKIADIGMMIETSMGYISVPQVSDNDAKRAYQHLKVTQDMLRQLEIDAERVTSGHIYECSVCGQALWSDEWLNMEHPFFHPYCKRCYADLKWWKISKNEWLKEQEKEGN